MYLIAFISEPDMSKFQQDVRNIPLAVPFKSRSNTIGPPYPYPGAPIRGMGRNNHHLSKVQNLQLKFANNIFWRNNDFI